MSEFTGKLLTIVYLWQNAIKCANIIFYSLATDHAKFLQDSTESSEDIKLPQTESVPSKDDAATVTVPVSSKEREQKQSSPLDKTEQPPPYEPGSLTPHCYLTAADYASIPTVLVGNKFDQLCPTE